MHVKEYYSVKTNELLIHVGTGANIRANLKTFGWVKEARHNIEGILLK